MQQSLERALERAESVIESAQQRPPRRKRAASGGKCLHQKLYDIYVEECEKEPEATEELRSNVNLLEKLVARESWPCLVVNLYPGKGGYSLMLKGENGSCSETIRMPYEDGEMLDYLDAEELPPVLVDLLEKSEVDVFHRGCVIAEVRDYRQCSNAAPPGYQSRHVLLRPTMQTLAADVQAIARDGQNWTQEDKLLLESQLILATAEPLCLEPSVAVACAENRLLYNRQKMNARPVKQSFKRYSLPALNREETLPHRPLPPQLRARARRGKATDGDAVGPHDLKISKAGNCVDMWKQRPCELAVPSEVDVGRYAKGKASAWRADPPPPGAWPVGKVREDSPLLRGEARGAAQTAAPTVGQWVNDPATSAKRSREEARCERQMSLPDHPSTEDPSSSSLPASETEAGRGSGRSEELVRERATCPVKMSWSPAGSASLSQLAPGKETQQPDMALVQSPVLGKGVKYLPSPTQLLPSSGKSSSGNFFVPEQASSILKSLASALASRPESVSQRSSMEMNQVNKMPTAILPTASSQRTTLGLSTVTSQRISALSTSFSSEQTPALSTVISSQSTPALSTIVSSKRMPTPSTVIPKRTPAMSTVTSSQRITVLSTVISQRTPALSTTISSQRTPATPSMANSPGPNIINVMSPVLGAPALASESQPVQGSTPGPKAPAEIKPSGGQTPSVQPGELQEPSQVGTQFFLKTGSSLTPVTLIQVPAGSVLLKTQQHLYHVTPQQQLTPISTSHPLQPGPRSSSAQDSSSQKMTLFTQQPVILDLTRAGIFQSQPSVLSQLGPHQQTPRQSLPQQRFQQTSTLQHPQQIQQLRILQQPVAVAATAAPGAQPPQTASPSTGNLSLDPPTVPAPEACITASLSENASIHGDESQA